MSLSWIILSGIEANTTGTGRLMQYLQDYVLTQRRYDGTIMYCPKDQQLAPDQLTFLVDIPRLTLFHPQMLGIAQVFELISRRAAAGRITHLYLLDSFFFCVRSYNHLDHEATPCLRCVGDSQWSNAAPHRCTPWPIADARSTSFIAELHKLVSTGSVHLLAQNTEQEKLARRHFGPTARITVVGLWCADWTAHFDAFLENGRPREDGAPRYDVVYHGSRDMAKGIGWVLAVAARTPELRYLIPIDRGAANVEAPPNVTVRNLRWDSGLHEAVKTAKLALAPSLWSSPCEGALIKNIAVARAPAVVDVPTAFSSEIPGNVVLKLPPDVEAGARTIRNVVASGWRPDEKARADWLSNFRTFNGALADAIIPRQKDSA